MKIDMAADAATLPMKLKAAIYWLFPSDEAWLSENPDCGFHSIDGEVALRFQSDPTLFVSWNQGRGEEGYRVAWSAVPFFNHDNMLEKDFSNSAIWSEAIGAAVHLRYAKADKTTIVVSGPNATVYLSAFEDGSWGVDTLHISNLPPVERKAGGRR